MIKKVGTCTVLLAIAISTGLSGQGHPSSDRYLDAHKKYIDAACPLEQDSIRHFVYFARDRELIHGHPFLKIERFAGAQIMYPWRQLEPERGKYDFSAIREDYEYLRSYGKKLFIQLQDATFTSAFRGVPEYLLTDEFDGGSVPQINENGRIGGWVAKRWNKQVRDRFALLLNELGKEFDGKVEGINLQETAIDINSSIDSTFTPEGYTEGLKINMLALKQAFPSSITMQYANFMPGEWLPGDDKGYLRSIYRYGEKIGVGLGGPDLMIKRKGQLNHTIAMMHEGTFTVPLGIAVQDGNYIEQTGNSVAVSNRTNIVPVLHAFAKDFLKVSYMFWSCEEPCFTEDVIPCFQSQSPD
ncbi:hypothetical protein EG830_14835 [bacterium]|nr:hypothetical protein [bacterium]